MIETGYLRWQWQEMVCLVRSWKLPWLNVVLAETRRESRGRRRVEYTE